MAESGGKVSMANMYFMTVMPRRRPTLERSCTVMRLPNAQKRNKELMASVQITPWNLHEKEKPDVIFKDQVAQRPELECSCAVGEACLHQAGGH